MEIEREALAQRIERAVGAKVHLAPGGPARARKIGVVTGGAGSEVFKAAAAGVDTFITGEGPHWSFTAAEELGVNLFYAGHYATEVFGVRELARLLEAKFGLPWSFLDHPTGLTSSLTPATMASKNGTAGVRIERQTTEVELRLFAPASGAGSGRERRLFGSAPAEVWL